MKDCKEGPECQEGVATLENKDEETGELKASSDLHCSQVKTPGKECQKSDHTFRDYLHCVEDMLDTMVNPFSYKDKNGVFRLVNEIYAQKILGLPKEDIIGKTLIELATELSRSSRRYIVEKKDPLEDCKEWIRIDTEILNNGGTKTCEQELIVADGTAKTFIINKSALCDEEGEIIGVTTVMQDITELRQMEKTLKQSLDIKNKLYEQIRRNERRYGIILEKTGQMVYDYDFVADKVDLLGSVEKVTGYTPEELKDISIDFWMKHVHPEDRDRLWKTYEKHMKYGGSFLEEYRFRRKSGEYIYFEEKGTDIQDSSEDIRRAIGVIKNITQEKLARQQLENSKETYRMVIEKTGQLVYEYDPKSGIITWEGPIEKLTGYSAAYFGNSGEAFWLEHIHPEDRKKVLQAHKYMQAGEDFQIEYRFRKKDGNYIYLEWNSVCLKNERGKVVRNLGIVKDITEQKLTGKSLQESEERYRTAAEQTGQVVFDLRLDTHEVEWAGAIREVTGYSPEEFKSIDESFWIEHLHPEDRARTIKSMENFFSKEARIQAEFRFRKKDGKYIYMELRGVWLKDEEGKVYRAIGIMKDITEWKCTLEKVEASERRYRFFIQNFQGIAFQADKNFIPVFMHGAVEEITGYTEEELTSKVKWKDIILPDDLPLILKEEEKVRNSPYRNYGKIDFRIVHRDGKIRWVHEIYQKFLGKDGKPKLYQGTIYDITERKETEEFLANLKLARQREIHHRIKNNLQVISSLLDLQADKFNNRECVKDSEVLEAFRESQDRVISIALIHEELHEGGGTENLNFSPYLKKLIGNLFQTYRLGNAAINLNMELEDNIFFNMDTAVPLGLIVNELVSNSLKHAFPGGKTGEVRVKLYRDCSGEHGFRREGNSSESRDTGFTLIVSDNGTGFPETVDLESPGTLGLQLVSILVNQLEGEIELKKENGTEFIIGFNVENKL